jgi:large subunit ribosomal protein L47
MFLRAINRLASTRCATTATVNLGAGLQHMHMKTPTAALLAGGSLNDSRRPDLRHGQHRRSIFYSAPLLHQSSSTNNDNEINDNDDLGSTSSTPDADEEYNNKKSIIDKWMRWNTASTFRYTPNSTLLSQISSDGSTSTSPLNAFRDLVPKAKREAEPVGRSWSVKELRRKSYDDLHKLWYVLYKERNMLLTETNLARRHGYEMIQPERKRKVQKSMGAIKHVLGERKRKKIGEYREYLAEMERLNQVTKKTTVTKNTVALGDNLSLEDGMEADAEKLSLNEKA